MLWRLPRLAAIGVLTLMVLAACGGAASGAPAATSAGAPTSGAPAEGAVASSSRLPASSVASAPARASNSTNSSTNLHTVNIGSSQIINYEVLYIATDKGYFRDAGLDAHLMPLSSGSDQVNQTAAGNLDVGAGGVGAAFLNAASRGLDLKIVAPLHEDRPPFSAPLVGSAYYQQRGELKSIADLKGKKVAINARGASLDYYLEKALEKGKLTLADVDVQTIPFADMPAALSNGAIWAAVIAEPGASSAVSKNQAFILSNDYLSSFQPTFVWMNPKFIANRRDDAVGFMEAYIRASRDLQGQYTPADLQILQKYTKLPSSTIEKAARPFHNPNATVHVQDLATLQDFYLQQPGSLTYKEPIDVSKLVDTSLAQDAIRTLPPAGGSPH